MDNTIDLRGKNVLITGGSRGIGGSIARVMAACGANVFINHLHDDVVATSLIEEMKTNPGVKAMDYAADIADEAAVAKMFAFADEFFGPVDVLVNNAGYETIEYALDLSLQDWDRVFNVCLRAAFKCTQEAARRMAEQRQGVIINISSIHDKVPRKGLVHYCAAKAGMNMMTKCLALELAEFNIRVVAVSPGAIETDMNREEINRFGRDRFNGWIPLTRVGQVEDIAWTCAFLACDKAGYYTATEIYIDGGYKETTIPYDPRKKKDVAVSQ